MNSSRFLQISPDILLEYVYTDQNVTSPETFNTDTYPIEIMRDAYTSGSYLFNTEAVKDTMGNYRDVSSASITANKSQYAYLDTDIAEPYNDFDPNLTNSNQLLQSFPTGGIDVVYDTVKVHFTSGFDFSGYDGLIFETTVPRRDGVILNLSSRTFLRSDTPIFNEDPFLLSNKLYASYIEWKVPSVYFMANENASSTDTLSNKLTSGQGFLTTPPITFKVSGILETVRNSNGYRLFNIQEINSASILNRDIYDNLYAQVVDSTGGDYFEISGEVTGSTLSNFIAQLNSEGGNYIAIHQITLSEQIGTTFTQTSDQMFTQTDNFDEPILYRPIVLNSANAVSFAINYTLRLFNRDDNTQIIKNARLVSFDVKKYGRKLMKINLGTVPTVAKVYNKVEEDNGSNITITNGSGIGSFPGQSSDQITEKLVVQTRYVTGFRDRKNIKAAITPVKIQNIKDGD